MILKAFVDVFSTDLSNHGESCEPVGDLHEHCSTWTEVRLEGAYSYIPWLGSVNWPRPLSGSFSGSATARGLLGKNAPALLGSWYAGI